MIDKKKNFLIVGLGLMGGSYANILAKKEYKIFAIDINKESIETAKKENIILNENETNEELIKKADYIIICLYPKATIKWIKENKIFFKNGTIITDIMGVKKNYIEIIQNEIPKNCEFISMHPMAGRESSGYAFHNEKVFFGANMIIIPTEKNTTKSIEFAYFLSNELTFKNIELLDNKTHDEMVAYLSQLPHILAVSLMNFKDAKHLHKYTGDSFRDLTRIAKINENLWSELFIENKENLLPLIDGLINELEDMKQIIENSETEKLKNKLIQSTIKRREFDK